MDVILTRTVYTFSSHHCISSPPLTFAGHTCSLLSFSVQVWGVDLQKNEMIVKDVILVAQGEMALEEFLKQVCTCIYMYILYVAHVQMLKKTCIALMCTWGYVVNHLRLSCNFFFSICLIYTHIYSVHVHVQCIYMHEHV